MPKDENQLQNRIRVLNAPDLIMVNASEEHRVLESKIPHNWKRGFIFPTGAL